MRARFTAPAEHHFIGEWNICYGESRPVRRVASCGLRILCPRLERTSTRGVVQALHNDDDDLVFLGLRCGIIRQHLIGHSEYFDLYTGIHEFYLESLRWGSLLNWPECHTIVYWTFARWIALMELDCHNLLIDGVVELSNMWDSWQIRL